MLLHRNQADPGKRAIAQLLVDMFKGGRGAAKPMLPSRKLSIGEVGYLVFAGMAGNPKQPAFTETFVVREGRIAIQTVGP